MLIQGTNSLKTQPESFTMQAPKATVGHSLIQSVSSESISLTSPECYNLISPFHFTNSLLCWVFNQNVVSICYPQAPCHIQHNILYPVTLPTLCNEYVRWTPQHMIFFTPLIVHAVCDLPKCYLYLCDCESHAYCKYLLYHALIYLFLASELCWVWRMEDNEFTSSICCNIKNDRITYMNYIS